MANKEHLAILQQGVKIWNEWRIRVWSQDLDPDLSGADLTGANLQGIDFRRTNLTNALLIGSNLEGGDFRGADFTGANLQRARLAGTSLYMANLSGVNLSEADLSGAELGKKLTKAILIRANLSQASLGGADLVEADLSNANLNGARLRSADLTGANLYGADLRGATLQGALLWEANLDGVRLSGTDLREARFSNSKLSGKSDDPFGDDRPGSVTGYGGSVDSAGWRNLKESPEEKKVDTPPEPLHFTAYFPPELKPQQWQTLLAYAHVGQAITKVKADSKKRLGLAGEDYLSKSKTALTNVERGAEIVIVPEMTGCRFNPPRASFLWLEDWHCVEFKVQASPDLPGFEPGVATNGKLAFYVGPILIAEVKFWAYFSEDTEPVAAPAYSEVTDDAYQSIFVSYSHNDTSIVEQLERAYRALGMQYLRDVAILRSGEEWNPALLRKINEADIFQLCWSNAAKSSVYVEQEWRHALDLQRSNFIRPTYWEQPLPEPPPELASIHFAYLDLSEP